jgi:hypothetical protein
MTKRSVSFDSEKSRDSDDIKDLTGSDFRLDKPTDVLELVGSGSLVAVIHERQINPDFFDLSTRFAGEVVQKCQNYGVRLAVVLEPDKRRSTHFQQFVQETNRQNRFVFVSSAAEGINRLKS